MITEEQISREKIVLAGDSAGAHLAFSLLLNLSEKYSSSAESKALCNPVVLVVILSWLSLYYEPTSSTSNADKDILSGSFMLRFTLHFLGHSPVTHESMNSPNLEFITPDPQIE